MSDPNGPPAPPSVVVVFGATGDLARRMVLPALYELHRAGLVEGLAVIGNGRGHQSDDQFRSAVRDACAAAAGADGLDEAAWQRFAAGLSFAGGGFTVADPGELPGRLDQAERGLAERSPGGSVGRLLYLAIPPDQFEPMTDAIGAHGLGRRARAVYEKPFGTSRRSFDQLDAAVRKVLDDDQILHIDHFLGKEATQDLHAVRFANGLFACAWDRHNIEAVQIDVPETLDVSGRGSFYDRTGALLDMIVTHLIQLAAEVAMEPPRSLDPDDVADARNQILASLKPVDPATAVFGQYEGYDQTDGVEAGSSTETFAAVRVEFDTDRWAGVPFVLRTGKALRESRQLVTVVFRPPQDRCGFDERRNVLAFDLAGAGSVGLRLLARQPSAQAATELVPVDLATSLSAIGPEPPRPAYVGLLGDALAGHQARFTRPDGLAHVWDAFADLLEHKPAPVTYAPGSTGPRAADELAAPLGWLRLSS